MVKSIIFDCFGVLLTDGWLPFKNQHFKDKPEEYDEATTLNKLCSSGLISYEDFVVAVAGLAGESPKDVNERLSKNVANKPLLDYITESLKPQYKIGLLSNTGRDVLETNFSPDELRLFDSVSLSFETGFTKPDVEAYEHIVKQLGSPYEECVFIDDQERHCKAAESLGMKVIVYKNFLQFRTNLEKILY